MVVENDDDDLLFERLIKTIGTTIAVTTTSKMPILRPILNPELDNKRFGIDFLKYGCEK